MITIISSFWVACERSVLLIGSHRFPINFYSHDIILVLILALSNLVSVHRKIQIRRAGFSVGRERA